MKPSSFRLVALSAKQFAPLFAQSDETLARQGIRRMTADAKPGYPCRVSLADAEPGEQILLLPFTHQPADSPYRASGPVFVRAQAAQAFPGIGEVPDAIRRRLLSVRAYDAADMMIGAEVIEGSELETATARLFGDVRVCYLHLHNARPGCFACRVDPT